MYIGKFTCFKCKERRDLPVEESELKETVKGPSRSYASKNCPECGRSMTALVSKKSNTVDNPNKE